MKFEIVQSTRWGFTSIVESFSSFLFRDSHCVHHSHEKHDEYNEMKVKMKQEKKMVK